jgi:hypothetical protein
VRVSDRHLTGPSLSRGREAEHLRSLLWSPSERLTPWVLHDLPRVAWIVESRATELTAEERQIVHDAAVRMLRVVQEPA